MNGPFPSCFETHYESEAKCKVNKTNFQMESFALSLAHIVRFPATRKWIICIGDFDSVLVKAILQQSLIRDCRCNFMEIFHRFLQNSKVKYIVILNFNFQVLVTPTRSSNLAENSLMFIRNIKLFRIEFHEDLKTDCVSRQ